MLEFAVPLGWLAASAVLVPVLLHLVRRPRQVVRLGSLRFLDAAPRRVRSLRWRDRLLLALRCLLLSLLAALLAAPLWRPVNLQPARWLLVAPEAQRTPELRTAIEKARADGFALRAFAPGFPILPAPGDSPASAERPAFSDPWSLLRELDARLPAGSRAIVAAPLQAGAFVGNRPVLSHVRVTWLPADSAVRETPVPAAVHVAVLAAANRADDARYVRATLAALPDVRLSDEAPQWIVRLGDAPFPASLQQRVRDGATLVSDAADSAPVVNVSRFADFAAGRVRVQQRTAPPAGAPLLQDSAGEALLTEERDGRGRHWRFALRFHPDWTDWPHTSAFPAWWQAQFFPPQAGARTLTPAQAAPLYAPNADDSRPTLRGFGEKDLRPLCWIAVVIVFVAERALAFRAQRKAPA